MFIIPNKIITNTFFNEYMEENECYGTFEAPSGKRTQQPF